ncbi:MAG TPA: STAS domain-containing protein [Herpetosiphonaceae bacterium]|nr:STAS domain-containing protein [Herpetosiphonaceae bacterium]
MRRLQRWSSPTALVVSAGLLVSAGIIAFYLLAAPALRGNAILQQQGRAETIKRDLEAHLEVSQQIARSTAALAAPVTGDVGQIERLLDRMLVAAQPETVFGIGVWFEPNVFTPTAALFGPYVHRVSGSDPAPVLTYEWTTPEYDFPNQPWYHAGKNSQGQTVFTDPYFDTDLVYMSIIQPFTLPNGLFGGMTSVDMILPQLQAIVLRANANPDEVIYGVTRSGHLLAHPDEALILEFMRGRGRPAESLLDVTEQELAAFVAEGPPGRRHADPEAYPVSSRLELSGWTLRSAARRGFVFRDVANLLNISIVALLFLWLGVSAILAIIRRSRARIHTAHQAITQSEHKYSELFSHAPYPIFLLEAGSGRFALANPAALDFYGYSAAELDQLAIGAILGRSAGSAHGLPARYAEAAGMFEDRHLRRDGQVADVCVRPQWVEIDGQRYLQCYIIDSSEQKQAEEQVQIQRELIRSQENALAMAATPLIPITSTIVAVPLIGPLDTRRARQIVTTLSDGVQSSRAQVVIIDVTGVSMLDVTVAELLIEATRVVRLLGARTAITGIQPDMAQVLVAQSLDLSDLVTYSTLQSGISREIARARIKDKG